MSYQPPQGPFPPPPGSPTGPEGQGQPVQPGQPQPGQPQPAPPTGPPAGYPPPGYGQAPAAGPPPGYTAPPPAPAAPREAVSGRHLASLLLVVGTALLVLADLVAAFTAGDDTFGIEFVDRLFLLGGVGGGFLYSLPTILLLSVLVIAALRLREGSTGPFDAVILVGALIVSALVTLFTLLSLFGSFAVDGLDPRFGFILLLLGALVISVAATWYAFGEFQTSRPARPTAPTYPQGYPQAYQPPAQGYPPSGYPPQG